MNRDGGEAQPFKMFVGGLDLETTSESLKAFFERFGEVEDSVVMRDGDRCSRGFGFITYTNMASLDSCLKSKPHVVDGKEVEAKMAIPKEQLRPQKDDIRSQGDSKSKKVFLGGIAPETTKEEITDVMEEFGEVEMVQIMTEKGTEKPRGFGFVTFKEFEAADNLCRKKYHRIRDRDVEVKKAISQDKMRMMGADQGSKSRGYSSDPGGRSALDPYGSRYKTGGYPMDYGRNYNYSQYNDYMRDYAMYDRGQAAAYGNYANYGRYSQQGYDMSYGMYPTQGGMGMGTYHQTPSNYGPSRGGYGGMDKDKERGGASGHGGYHPYRR